MAFAVIDVSFNVSQHLQMLSIRHYANVNDIKISFYGSELSPGQERGILFKHYTEVDRDDTYLFFTIRQFVGSKNSLRINYLSDLLSRNLKLHFANENILLCSPRDITDLALLLMSSSISRPMSKEKETASSSQFLSSSLYLHEQQ